MSEHPIAQRITGLLDQHKCWYETFEHEQVRTSEEAAKLRPNYTLEQGAKAILLRVKVPSVGKKFVMLVLPGSQKFDSAKVKPLLHSNDIRFATEEEVDIITGGVKPGGVPPFGNLFDIEVVCDKKLFESEKIIFNAGRNYSIGMKSEDYKMLVSPLIADIGA
jgi:Ala-tRNA(Pro) deacylase